MKHIALGILMFVGSICAAQDFRSVTWGDERDKVITKESSKIVEDDSEDSLMYRVDVFGYNLNLQYIFEENKLFGASYFRTIKNDAYVQAYLEQKDFFLKMKSGLDLKYGKQSLLNPETDVFIFYDDQIKKKYVNEDMGQFLDAAEKINSIEHKHIAKNMFSIGYTYCAKYETERTTILLVVTQKGMTITQEVMYVENGKYRTMNEKLKKEMLENSGL